MNGPEDSEMGALPENAGDESEYLFHGDARHEPPASPPTQHDVAVEGTVFHEVMPAPTLKMHVQEEVNDRKHIFRTIWLCLITVILTLAALVTFSVARYAERQSYNRTLDALTTQVTILKGVQNRQQDTIKEQDTELTCRAEKQATLSKNNAKSGQSILNLIVLEASQRYAELQGHKGNPAALGAAIRESNRSLKDYDKANRVYQQEIRACLEPPHNRPGG